MAGSVKPLVRYRAGEISEAEEAAAECRAGIEGAAPQGFAELDCALAISAGVAEERHPGVWEVD